MNNASFFRILWKEYRAQRAGWIAMALAIVLISAVVLMDPWINRDQQTLGVFVAAIALAALYALMSSVSLFATERENGTYDFLRALPVEPWTAFFGKVTFAIGSAAIMFAFAWTFALVVIGVLPEARQLRLLWTYCGLTAVEFCGWGMLFSLWTKRTIVAASLAGTIPAVALSVLWNQKTGPSEAILGRIIVLGLVVAADLFLAKRWLREKRLSISEGAGSAVRFDQRVTANWAGRFGRLVWQEMRQSVALSAAIGLTMLPFIAKLWIDWLRPGEIEARTKSAAVFPFAAMLIIASSFSPVLLGATIFLGDQTGHCFRFLAERGFPPRLVWFTRHLRGLAVVLFGLALFLPPSIAKLGHHFEYDAYGGRHDMQLDDLEAQLGVVAAAYACGQLCSLTFRSGILAAVFGGILTLVMCGWAATTDCFGLSWTWTVAPLVAALFAATSLRAADWLLERNSWRTWLRPGLVIAVPALAILLAIPLVRIYEIPLVSPGFDPNEVVRPISPDEQKARDLYAQAIDVLRKTKPLASNSAYGNADPDVYAHAITLALEASRYPLPGFSPDPNDEKYRWDDVDWELRLAIAVFDSGVKLQTKGKLDEALDRYLAADHIFLHIRQRWPWAGGLRYVEVHIAEQLTYWAAEPGQESARVLKGIQKYEEQWRYPPSPCDEVEFHYLTMRDSLEHYPWRGPYAEYVGFERYAGFARWLPWERARALRALNVITAEELNRCHKFDVDLAAGKVTEPPPRYRHRPLAPQLSRDSVTYGFVDSTFWNDNVTEEYLRAECCRRATTVILAIEAWRLDHGALPESLAQLRGKYLDRLPVNPYTGRDFDYEPKGLPVAVKCYVFSGADESFRAMAPGQPFIGGQGHNLWSSFEANKRDAAIAEIERKWNWVCPIPSSGGKPQVIPVPMVPPP